jgi:drug/metabolite transporter (DMT)-like permease
VGALVGLDVEGSSWLAVAAVGVTVLGYSLGPIIIEKRLRDVPSLPVIAASLAVNTLIYAPFSWFARPGETVPANAWASMIVLGVLCTAIAFVLLFALIAEVGAPRAQVITYVNPAVAVILGVVVLSEPVTLGIVIGFPLVLLGSWLATRGGNVKVEAEPHP